MNEGVLLEENFRRGRTSVVARLFETFTDTTNR
jgi:hypothetical protein